MSGYMSESMGSSRITRHGKITSLAAAFELADKKPFSIFLIPKTDNETVVLLSVKLYQEDTSSDCPFQMKQWSPVAISSIAISTILTTHDIYWGA